MKTNFQIKINHNDYEDAIYALKNIGYMEYRPFNLRKLQSKEEQYFLTSVGNDIELALFKKRGPEEYFNSLSEFLLKYKKSNE